MNWNIGREMERDKNRERVKVSLLSLRSQCGKFFEGRKCSQVPLGVEDFLSDEGTLSFRQGR